MTGAASTPPTPTPIIHLAATTHFPIKLIATNFTVWRKQVHSMLTGMDLDKHLTTDPPSKFLNNDVTKQNPEFLTWFRQDQIILSAILGSCSELIQPVISSANTSRQAWDSLNQSYASTSRSRIISLKSKLAKNPKGTRSITEFLHDMKSIADDLALAQNPISDEDLIVHILGQLGDDYTQLAAALKVQRTALTFREVFDILVDHERSLIESGSATSITTVNNSQRQSSRHYSRSSHDNRTSSGSRFYNSGSRPSRFSGSQPNYNSNSRGTRPSTFCQYCNIPGHDTKECRKLARFLRDNNISISHSSTPTVNTTSATSVPTNSPWMFDTGASDHVTSNRASLHTLSEYGGPDEIVLGDGSSHGGVSNAGSERQ